MLSVKDTFDMLYKEWLVEQNKIRVDLQRELYTYYSGDKDGIEKYLKDVLGKVFDAESLNDFIFDYINITQKLIDDTSVVYDKPAKRSVVLKGKTDKTLTSYLNTILPTRMNTKDRMVNRMGKLHNTALMEVFFNKFTNKLDFRVDPPYKLTVIPHEDDDFRIGTVLYDKRMKHPVTGKMELFTVVWSDTKHYMMDANTNEYAIKNNANMINPFGTPPFAIYRNKEMEDFWGTGQYDVVKANEIVNVFLTDLTNGTLMSTWGTPLYINCGLDKKASDEGSKDNKKRLRIGPKHPISVENLKEGDIKPSIEYVSHNAKTNELMLQIDWRIKAIAANKGLDPNSFLHEVKATSGFSKMMDRISQIKIQNDDIEPAREFEEDRFRKLKAVNNYYAQTPVGKKAGLVPIPEEALIKVDFAEIKGIETKEEKWLDRAERERRGMGTIIDWMKEDNPDLDVEDAKEIIKTNLDLLKELGLDGLIEEKTRLSSGFEGINFDEEDNTQTEEE